MDQTPKLDLNKPEEGNTDWAAPINTNWDTLDEAVLNSLFVADTILAANVIDTPQAVTVDEERILGRKQGGNIAALAKADVCQILAGTPASGDTLYHNGSAWTRLAKGSDDQVLTLASGLPSWAASSPIAGVGSPSGGYVTRDGTNLKYAIDQFNKVFLYESSTWTEHTIPDAGITAACTGLTASTLYYLYVYDSSGTLTLDLSTTAPTTQNGLYVKTGATDRLLITRCRTDSSGDVQDTETQRLINNVYNKRLVWVRSYNTTDYWTYGTSSWRECNNGTGQVRGEYVADGIHPLLIVGGGLIAGQNGRGQIGVAHDSTTTVSGYTGFGGESGNQTMVFATGPIHDCRVPTAGYHYFTIIEYTLGGSIYVYGTQGPWAVRAYGLLWA